ncbi:glycosyltransferase [Xenorhabdus bovienii]|uniref:glycosyltransferase n=1 Tax=Xenorhabdus bovienii TaxID=40576 RepID=UPI0021584D7E|nr:glycosyltransferase [Xenorhabdus bovienii]
MKKKIALFMPNFLQGGAESVMVSIANHLSNFDFIVHFIVTDNKGPLKNELDKKVIIKNLNCTKTLYSLPSLSKYIYREKPDIILSTLKENNIISILAKKITLSKAKIIIREANTLSAEFKVEKSFIQIIKKHLVKWLYPHSNCIIALSKHMERDLNNFLNLKNKNIKIIYNPVNIKRIEQLSKEKNSNFIEYDKSVKNIVSLARLYNSKGYDTIFNALFMLKDTKQKFHFYAIGDGPSKNELISLSNELGLKEHITFLGFKENPFPFLIQADCFILASHYEGMPNSLLQAMALNIPVICSDSPGASAEVLLNGKYGLLFNVGDSKKLYENIVKTLSKDEYIETKNIINSQNNQHNIMSQYKKTIDELLENQ